MDAAEETVKSLEESASSCPSMSDASINILHEFTRDAAGRSVDDGNSELPASSCQSFKSNASINIIHDFKRDTKARSTNCPDSSCLSLKNDSSINILYEVRGDVSNSLNNNAECYLKSSLRKYACQLTMDPNTAHSLLSLSEDRQTMTRTTTAQLYPDSPDRFIDFGQVLCEEALSSCCYWEVEWTGERTGIGVAYKGISRKAKDNESVLGYNDQSWGLRYCNGKYTSWHNRDDQGPLPVPYFSSKRVGVFLDWSAGSLSFYAVSCDNTMMHLHTFHGKFSEPLYPGFRLGLPDTSLVLCRPENQ